MFSNTYAASKKFLLRLGERILNRRIYYHLFRHSSATYYASKLNRQQLCYRYGWRFSSNMPDVYISRAGMDNAELDEKFKSASIGEIKDSFERAKVKSKIEMEKLTKENERLHQRLMEIEKVVQTLHKVWG